MISDDYDNMGREELRRSYIQMCSQREISGHELPNDRAYLIVMLRLSDMAYASVGNDPLRNSIRDGLTKVLDGITARLKSSKKR